MTSPKALTLGYTPRLNHGFLGPSCPVALKPTLTPTVAPAGPLNPALGPFKGGFLGPSCPVGGVLARQPGRKAYGAAVNGCKTALAGA